MHITMTSMREGAAVTLACMAGGLVAAGLLVALPAQGWPAWVCLGAALCVLLATIEAACVLEAEGRGEVVKCFRLAYEAVAYGATISILMSMI